MVIIGISGGTASGKTSLVKELTKFFSKEKLQVISQDSYYHSNTDLSIAERAKINFDHPNSIDFDLLVKHIVEIKSGNLIQVPSYSFLSHNRTTQTTTLFPSEIIIVEGILLFNDKRLVDLFDSKIFIHADADERFIRRVKRDSIERGRNFEEVSTRYLSTLKPMHEQYIEPTKKLADLIIENNNESINQLQNLIQFIQKNI
jgi:uridine kinase